MADEKLCDRCLIFHVPGTTCPERVVESGIDVAALSHAHVALVQVEEELRAAGRKQAADGLAVVKGYF